MSLAPALLRSIRLAAARGELLCIALELLAERDRELAQARSTIAFQRLELRAFFTGRTLGEQRQADQHDEAHAA